MKDKPQEGEVQCTQKKCHYIWRPRTNAPKRCPKCLKWQEYNVDIKNQVKK